MKYNFKYLIFTFILLLIPIKGIFAECSKEELNYFIENQDKFKITYEFDRSNEKYILTFNNPAPEIFSYMISTSFNFDCDSTDIYAKKCKYFGNGSYFVSIVGETDTCNDTMYEFIQDLPYNEFYLDEVCNGAEEFVLCSPTYDKKISYEDFLRRVNLYKEDKSHPEYYEDEENTLVEENNLAEEYFTKIVSFVKENILLISVIIIALILLIIIITASIKRYKRRWKLE